jgi:hypothetical protein
VAMSRVSALGLDPATYKTHALHAEDSVWQEKNCYIDVWIELLHALGLDPLPLLAFTAGIDFVDDQWVFYKPSHADLYALYGIDVQEMNVWRSLSEHAVTHVSKGRIVLTEIDAFFLPDTAGTDYRSQHTKTTIGIESIDLDNHELRYFHNKSYYTLNGDDFLALFRTPAPGSMPLFAELVRLERVQKRAASELVSLSTKLLAQYFRERPRDNPIERFGVQFSQDLQTLTAQGIARYHAYAFATLRQLGSNFELFSWYLRWLGERGELALEPAAAHFKNISDTAQLLILKGARAVNGKKNADFSEQFRSMSQSWEEGMKVLGTRFES